MLIHSAMASEAAAQTSETSIQSGFMSFVPFILIFFVVYVLLIRPQEKKRKAHEEMLKTIKSGEEIITIGGIFGKVVKVNNEENIVHVELADNLVIKMLRSAISDVINRKNQKQPSRKSK